ncbi:hypothetical protein [Vibrio aerogenes]|nr:hypothetical protein [Vibrio aerogenes]
MNKKTGPDSGENPGQITVYTNMENKLIILMCLVEQTYKGMDALV